MEKELTRLQLNKNRLVKTLISMFFVFILLITSLFFGKYVDANYTITTDTLKSTSIIYVFFSIPFVLVMLCAYLFFFIYIQNFYDILVKQNFVTQYKYWFFFYVSFFIPIIKYFIPLIGILYLLWKLSSFKIKIIIILLYYLSFFIVRIAFYVGILSGLVIKVSDKVLSQAIIKSVNLLITWTCFTIIIHIMNVLLLNALKCKTCNELNLTTAST